MSVAGFSKKPFEHILECRKEDPNPLSVTIRRLSRLEVSEIVMACGGGEESFEIDVPDEDAPDGEGKNAVPKEPRKIKINYSMLHQQIKIKVMSLQKALSGWESFKDEDGQLIPFSLESIECFDEDVTEELFEIVSGGLKREDVKNSVPPSASEDTSAAEKAAE